MHWKYLKYIIRHKWFVLVAAWKIGAPLWAALVHDMSKLLPSEWLPYCRFFYGEHLTVLNPRSKEKVAQEFDYAWMAHQRRNLHHWQAWVLKEDNGATKLLPMPERYVLEMVADWMGAGRAITGRWEVVEWYQKCGGFMLLHPITKNAVEIILRRLK